MLDVLDVLKRHFGDEEGDVVASIEREERQAREWAAENEPPESNRAPRELGKVDAQATPQLPG